MSTVRVSKVQRIVGMVKVRGWVMPWVDGGPHTTTNTSMCVSECNRERNTVAYRGNCVMSQQSVETANYTGHARWRGIMTSISYLQKY